MKGKIRLIQVWSVSVCALTLGVVFFLFAYVIYHGAGAITWEFLTDVPRGLVIGTDGGILPAIVGSLYYTLIAGAFATLLGVFTALYQVFYCKNDRISSTIALVMQCMAGVPSIVMGLFGYSFFVLTLGWGKCILAGGITQGIMILPIIQVRAEKAFREVDRELVNASYALGMTRAYTIRRIILPQSLPQLVSGVILGTCHAMGAAAPLIFTGAVIMSKVPKNLMKPAMALPYHLYMLLTQGTSSQNAYGTAFVMMVIVLVANTAATWFAWRRKR
ncbi:MAG: phosphate ABC transporter permease PstA [Oscillospiraceae bacterium]|nr:phosphate ABC transporter permease PstA [Oscillospiraceae bacterium]